MLKKITIIIWLVTALILAVLVINYYSNRQFIKNYDSGVYQENELGFLGFTQPYIEHFNKGTRDGLYIAKETESATIPAPLRTKTFPFFLYTIRMAIQVSIFPAKSIYPIAPP